ncbi:MAG: 2'-5' RNA ligase family protein [Gaiellaceae bacterium]
METAVVVVFPEATPVVDGWREQTCLDKPSIGIPPHVTLLHPFVPAEEAAGGCIEPLRELFASAPAFRVSFNELRRWPGMAYLAPEPPEPFARLTEAIVERWPEYLPYEGIHDEVIPHLTVAYGDHVLLEEVEADVVPKLPIETNVTEAVLLEELEPDVRWAARARFSLGT